MKIVKLTESLAVSGQITPQDVAAIAAQGYEVLVNNRPDGEEGAQPAGAAIAEAAAAAGLEYHYMPVTHADFPGPDFAALCELLEDTSRRTFAFCRSGTRCANLWVASVAEVEREEAVSVAGQQGFDLGMAARFLSGDG
jgi:uncharacterized protein (TIGR01244 family)